MRSVWLLCVSVALALGFQEHKQLPDDLSGYDILIVGAGLSGTVMADLYARRHGKRILMIDRRGHIAGNCFDYIDKDTNILVSKYGAHLFHTRHEQVWKYMQQYSDWRPYEHRVIGQLDGRLVPIPVTVETVNVLFDKHMKSVEEMTTWITEVRAEALGDAAGAEPQNSRDVGLQRVGQQLYNKIFHEYTKKQWDVYPEDLGPEVLARIPVRESWDDRYFPDDPYQALPKHGYTKWFEAALDHPSITVVTGIDYYDLISSGKISGTHQEFEKVFFTGQIDQLLQKRGVDLPPLQYRSIRFESKVIPTTTTMQSAFVVNYPQFQDGNFTRIVEYKHAYQQLSDKTIAVKEFSTGDGDPYYPFPNPENKALFEKYKAMAREDEELGNIHFIGRLANYKYYNMDDAVNAALQFYASLEGESALDFIKTLPSPQLHEKMTVHIIINVFKEDLSWVADLCKMAESALPGQLDMRWFIYLKNPDQSVDDLKNNVLRILDHCPHKDITAVKLPNVGREGHSWLTHMMMFDFEFGDANLFFQGSIETDIPHAVHHINAIKLRLFDRNATRASQPATYNHDIQDVESYVTQPRITALQTPAAPNAPIDHHLHWRALEAVELEIPFDATFDDCFINRKPQLHDHMRRIKQFYCPTYLKIFARENPGNCGDSHPIVYRGEFATTDAAIRRVLAKHRTRLLDLLSNLGASADPVEGHVLERMWLRLFRYR